MPGPLLPPDGPAGVRRARICRGILREAALFVVLTVFAPILLVGAGMVDLALWLRRRKPWMAVRILARIWRLMPPPAPVAVRTVAVVAALLAASFIAIAGVISLDVPAVVALIGLLPIAIYRAVMKVSRGA